MKRFLSIALCVMMLVSVFSIGASAMVPVKYATEPAPNYVALQDFSNAELNNYPKNGQGTITIEPEAVGSSNNVLKLVTASTAKHGVVIDKTLTPASFTADNKELNIEFKVYPSANDDTLRVVVNLPFFTEKITSTTTGLAYSIYGPTFTANTWNTVKIAIDIPDGYVLSSPNTSYPSENSDSARIYVNGTKLTKKTRNQGTASKNSYCVETVTTARDALVSFIYYPSAAEKTYLFDDISIYKMVNYPVKHGDIVHTIEDEFKVAASAVKFPSDPSTYRAKFILNDNITAFGNKAIITFDAKVVTAGYPFCMNVVNASGGKKMAVNILPTGEIGTDWYTYRVETGYDAENPAFNNINVYRRKAGTNDPFVLLEKDTMENGGDYLTSAKSLSSADNAFIQIGYFEASYELLDGFTADQAVDAEWTVRNIQIIEVDDENGAVTGKATANDDGTADVKLFYTTNAGATTPIVAVYNSNEQLVDIEYATAAINGEGEFNATVDYVAGNTVKLFIWDGIATGVPVLKAAVPINVQ